MSKRVIQPKYEILFFLKRKGGKATYNEIIQELKMYPSTFYMNIKDLLSQRLVVKDGKHYVLTDAGEEEVQQAKREVAEVVA